MPNIFDQDLPGEEVTVAEPEEAEEQPEEAEEEETEAEEAPEESESDETEEEGEETEEKEEEEAETGQFKLKIDGEEVEKSREEVIRLAQKGFAADKRFEEAAALRKEAEAAIAKSKDADELAEQVTYFRDRMVEDPIGTARQLLMAATDDNGKPLYDEEQLFNALYQYTENMFAEMLHQKENPDARRARYREEEAKRLRHESETARQRLAEIEQTKEEQALEQEMQKETTEALESAGLPIDEDTIEEVARVLVAADEAKKDLTPTQAVEIVKQRILDRRRRALDGLTYEEIKANEKLLKEIRQKDLQELKSKKHREAGATKTRPTRRKAHKAKAFHEIFEDPFEGGPV